MRTGERLSRGRPGRASCTLPRQPGLQCARLILGGLKSVNTDNGYLFSVERNKSPLPGSLLFKSHLFSRLCLSPSVPSFNRLLLSSSFFQALYSSEKQAIPLVERWAINILLRKYQARIYAIIGSEARVMAQRLEHLLFMQRTEV